MQQLTLVGVVVFVVVSVGIAHSSLLAVGCVVETCSTEGQICGTGSGTLTTLCIDNTFCDDNGVCVRQFEYGNPCASDDQCLNGICQNNLCSKLPSMLMWAGDACNINSDCQTGLTCTNNTCTGGVLGETCGYMVQCNPNLYCNNSRICTPMPVLNEPCDTIIGCKNPFYCQPTATNSTGFGVCVTYDSIQENSLCDLHRSPPCPDGTTCIPVGTGEVGVCQTPKFSPIVQTCNDNPSVCVNSICECEASSGYNICVLPWAVNPPGTRAQILQKLNCYEKYCNATPTPHCYKQYCLSEFCADQLYVWDMFLPFAAVINPQCMITSLEESLFDIACTNTNDLSSGSEEKADQVGIAVGVTFGVIIFVVIVIYTLLKKKSVYEFVFRKPFPKLDENTPLKYDTELAKSRD